MPRLSKRAISIREPEALAGHRVRKAFICLCFYEEDSSEDDIDNWILAELAVLKASRYCLRGPYRQWDSNWERMLEDGMVSTCPMMIFCPSFAWIDCVSCNWTVWPKMMESKNQEWAQHRFTQSTISTFVGFLAGYSH